MGSHHTAGSAAAIAAVSEPLEDDLGNAGMSGVFIDIELPLAPVLAQMERAGFRLDLDELDRIRRKLDDAIDAAALRCFAPREVSCIRLVAPARRYDNIAESLCASARGHIQRRVAPDRPQREPAFIVAG